MKTRRFLPFAIAILGAACAPAAQSPGGGSPETGGDTPATGGRPAPGSGGRSTGGAPPSATGGAGPTGGGTPATGGAGGSASATGGGIATGGATGTGGSGAGTGGATGTGGASSGDGPGATGDASAGDDTPPPAGGGCAGAKFCDDFEGYPAGMPPAGGMFRADVAGGGSLRVDGTRAFGGKQSIAIKVTTGGGYPGTWLTFTDLPAKIPSNDLHGRAMIYLVNVPGNAHWDGINASGPLAGGGNGTYILGGMNKKFMSVYHPGDCSVDSSTVFPVGRWACIQWEFKGAKDGTHLHKMMLDGQVVNNGIQDGSQGFCVQGGSKRDWKAPTFTTLKVGYVHYGSSPNPIEMWIDDLAFGEQPIACPPPK